MAHWLKLGNRLLGEVEAVPMSSIWAEKNYNFDKICETKSEIVEKISSILHNNVTSLDEYDQEGLSFGDIPRRCLFKTKETNNIQISVSPEYSGNKPHEILARNLVPFPQIYEDIKSSEKDVFHERASRYAFMGQDNENRLLFEARERIFIDLPHDQKLNNYRDEFIRGIQIAKSNTRLSRVQTAALLYNFLREICFNRIQLPSTFRRPEDFPFGSISSVWKLGDIPETGAALCRHIQLLGKIFGQSVGLKIGLQRGEVFGKVNGKPIFGSHAWLICMINNTPYLMDPTLYYKDVNEIRYLSQDGGMDLSASCGKKLYNPMDFV